MATNFSILPLLDMPK